MFTAAQIHKIEERYHRSFPKTPVGFKDPAEYRTPCPGEHYLCPHAEKEEVRLAEHYFENASKSPDQDPCLILIPKPKRYRFICDDPTPRRIKLGEWTTYLKNNHVSEKFVQADDAFCEEVKYSVLIFRREEILD